MEEYPPPRCPKCGADLRAGGLSVQCPGCLIGVALPENAADPMEWSEPTKRGSDERPRRIGGYELIKLMARGGMGTVWRARHVSMERLVALKVLAEGALAEEDAWDRFRLEALAAGQLDHAHIVPVYDVGEDEGRPYFTMKLVEGGTLADHIQRFQVEPRRAAKLVATLAHAMHSCHQHGILHRDLKPANVLLGTDDHPYIADFGVACVLDEADRLTRSGISVGTPSYMAPEQAEGRSRHSTIATDVYGLGAILYELLTGRPPFEGDTPVAILRKVLKEDPRSPRTLNSSVDKKLETICLKCLEKKPTSRYGSAEELAHELERYLSGKPLQRRRTPGALRAWWWCQRHRALASLLITAVWLMLITTVAAILVARAQGHERRNEELNTNAFAAQTVAGSVLFRLKQYSDTVAQAAGHSGLIEALAQGEQATLEDLYNALQGATKPPGDSQPPGDPSSFDYWFILDAQGNAIARWPEPPREFLGRNFGFRDYFEGARKLAQTRHMAYVSRGFASEADEHYRIAVSAPVLDAQGTLLGVIVGMVDTGSSLGSFRLNETNATHRTAVLVTLMDRSRAQAEQCIPDRDIILLHDGLDPGNTTALDLEVTLQLQDVRRSLSQAEGPQLRFLSPWPAVRIEGYRDPLSKDEGPWLAAFAPVGYTGIGVVVQTPANAATALDKALALRLALWGGLPFLLGEFVLGLLLWRPRR